MSRPLKPPRTCVRDNVILNHPRGDATSAPIPTNKCGLIGDLESALSCFESKRYDKTALSSLCLSIDNVNKDGDDEVRRVASAVLGARLAHVAPNVAEDVDLKSALWHLIKPYYTQPRCYIAVATDVSAELFMVLSLALSENIIKDASETFWAFTEHALGIIAAPDLVGDGCKRRRGDPYVVDALLVFVIEQLRRHSKKLKQHLATTAIALVDRLHVIVGKLLHITLACEPHNATLRQQVRADVLWLCAELVAVDAAADHALVGRHLLVGATASGSSAAPAGLLPTIINRLIAPKSEAEEVVVPIATAIRLLAHFAHHTPEHALKSTAVVRTMFKALMEKDVEHRNDVECVSSVCDFIRVFVGRDMFSTVMYSPRRSIVLGSRTLKSHLAWLLQAISVHKNKDIPTRLLFLEAILALGGSTTDDCQVVVACEAKDLVLQIAEGLVYKEEVATLRPHRARLYYAFVQCLVLFSVECGGRRCTTATYKAFGPVRPDELLATPMLVGPMSALVARIPVDRAIARAILTPLATLAHTPKAIFAHPCLVAVVVQLCGGRCWQEMCSRRGERFVFELSRNHCHLLKRVQRSGSFFSNSAMFAQNEFTPVLFGATNKISDIGEESTIMRLQQVGDLLDTWLSRTTTCQNSSNKNSSFTMLFVASVAHLMECFEQSQCRALRELPFELTWRIIEYLVQIV